MKKLRCPLCESEKITDHRNGQERPVENEEDELYVALEPDWFDGSVSQLECENGHTFYISHEELGFTPTEYKPMTLDDFKP